jgi:LmbE family N-acetylglucosaminyl deacetylase
MLTHIYLSPHLDDAVLSCGGMIHSQTQTGERVIVVTVCAGDPPSGPLSAFAQSLHRRWETPEETVAARRAEDCAALTILGAEGIHLPVPDCIYRTHPTFGQHLYASEESLFGQLHPSEEPLIQKAAQEISEILSQAAPYRFYAPLGVGNHVDHQLARQAAESAGGVFAYFEDYPYVARKQSSSTFVETRVPEIVPLTEEDLSSKMKAIAEYKSQISSFWPNLSEMEAAIREFARHRGGGFPAERLWFQA